MDTYEVAEEILRENGYTGSENISDFWFANKERLQPIVSKVDQVLWQDFDLMVRWKSDLGQACHKAIMDRIRMLFQKRNDYYRDMMRQDPNLFPPMIMVELDFTLFSFSHAGRVYTLDEFASQFNTSRVGGSSDLRGIDLSGISLSLCSINNCFLMGANFSGARLDQVELHNTLLVRACFRNARIVLLRMDDRSSIDEIDIAGAALNVVPLKSNVKLREVSYFWLVSTASRALFHPKDTDLSFKPTKHTRFSCVSTDGLTAPENKRLKEYVNWYQHVTHQLEHFNEVPFLKRAQFVFSIITTKYWTSYKALAAVALVINLLYGFLFFSLKSLFDGISSYLSAVYYSVVTFTTLGYGDIRPLSDIGRLLVISEVVLGYITLGIFVFLISDKVNKRY